VLGELRLEGRARAFALQRVSAERMVDARVALVGDAAHVIHPLAGQGANLGLQDARVLAQTLVQREPGRDPGDQRLLRRPLLQIRSAQPLQAGAAAVPEKAPLGMDLEMEPHLLERFAQLVGAEDVKMR